MDMLVGRNSVTEWPEMSWSKNVPKYSKLLKKASVIVVPRGGSWCPRGCWARQAADVKEFATCVC